MFNTTKRRTFLKQSSLATAAVFTSPSLLLSNKKPTKKLRIALVGTGTRGINMWGRRLRENYDDYIEFVGLSDINPGRLAFGKDYIGCDCPTFVDFEEMMRTTKPETLIVTTVDSTHHEFIIKGMEMGANIITEKPMTTDEEKCQAILDAEKRTGKTVKVMFNYRYSPHRQRIYEILRSGQIGDIVSCDFHWYLDIYHGAAYFRRWHGLREKSGTLLVHKSTHHFDLLNWWLDSEPEEVSAYGDLEFYGANNEFRHSHCRPCPHKNKCDFYWKIDDYHKALYADHEEYDGYLRDGCVWRKEIDIYDKMSAQIKYANNAVVNYSLTTYSPYEGYRIAFNGTKGRVEAWIKERQPWVEEEYDEIQVTENFGDTQYIRVKHGGGGHGGGDVRMQDKVFVDPNAEDKYKQSAGSRDGAMSVLIGIAARKSIEEQRRVKIEDLTSLKPKAKK